LPEVLTGWSIIIGVALNSITESKGAVLSLEYKRKRKPKGGKE
jgi:hypothetical protein